jgi:hypothetical protein
MTFKMIYKKLKKHLKNQVYGESKNYYHNTKEEKEIIEEY